MLSAGSKFGKYTVVRTLGTGGMGAVYLVRHDVLDAYFALKVLSADVAARNAQFIPRFLREAKLCCRIRHPNLVSVHDAGRDEATGLHYLVMDYAPGGNLREMLDAAGGPLDRARALKIMRELASALVTAAEFDLVHRDIKPENIMFGPSGEAKLADLGIAKAADDSTLVTMENAVFGTPAYMSPEQAYDSGKVDARADIYSLGIVFFEILSGRRPYDGSSSMNIIAKVLSREPVPDVRSFAPDVPEDIAAVVHDMCVKDVSRRIPTARALLQRLDEIAGSKTYVVPPRRKHAVDPMILLSVVGAFVALSLVGALAWVAVKGRVLLTDKASATPKDVVAPLEMTPIVPEGIAEPTNEPPLAEEITTLATNEPPLVVEPATLATNEPPLVVEPAPLATNDSPLVAANAPLATNDSPLVVENAPLATNDSPLVVENATLATNDSPLVVENAPLATNEPSVVLENATTKTKETSVVPEQAKSTGEPPITEAKSVYKPPPPPTIIRQKWPERHVEEIPSPVADPIEAGKAVVIGGEGDDVSAVKARLGVNSFQTAENSAQILKQIDDICAKNPSCVYIKLGSMAIRDRMAKDIFDNHIGKVANRFHDRGVNFQFVLEEDTDTTRPYNDVIREVCNQKSYDIFNDAEQKGTEGK